MQTLTVDVAIIGAGSAGLNARREVLKAGGSATLIESGPYGTTCARVGCMPSKLLIAAAEVAHEVGGAERFGINVRNGWSVDGQAVLARVRGERDRFVGFVVRDTEALPEEQRLRGRARFVSQTTLEVDDHTRVQANAVVIATGSTPWIPPPFDTIKEHVIDNDDVFELEDLPKSVAVIGTGIIGIELGQALSRLGVETTFFNPADVVGPFTDPEINKAVCSLLGAEFDLQLKSEIQEARSENGGIVIRWRDLSDAGHEKHFEKVLVAAGRRANLAGLGLEETSLSLDEKGRPPWDPRTTQCGDAPIFMAGDVAAHRPLLHEATDEGRIAGANAMRFPDVTAHVRRTPLAIAFTNPQMAIVGSSYREINTRDVEIGTVSYEDQGRARVMGQNRGLIRIYGDRKSCTLIGAEMFGPRVEHMAHLLSWSVQQRMTVNTALQMPFYHPVVEEGLRTALRDLAMKLKITGDCRAEDFAEAPGT